MPIVGSHLSDANFQADVGQPGGGPLAAARQEDEEHRCPAPWGDRPRGRDRGQFRRKVCRASGRAATAKLRASGRRAWLVALVGPLAAGPLWLWAWTAMDRQPPVTFLALTLLVLLGVAAVTDVRWHRIPNWATYTALLWAVALNAAHALGLPQPWRACWEPSDCRTRCWAAGACFLCALLLFGTTGGGAGDVKLLTVIGATLGLNPGIRAALYGFIAAGAGCLAWALWQHGPLAVLKAFGRLAGHFFVPYAGSVVRRRSKHGCCGCPCPWRPFRRGDRPGRQRAVVHRMASLAWPMIHRNGAAKQPGIA